LTKKINLIGQSLENINSKISVIIPCRNEEKYISGCLESILHNDYPKEFIEVFVVDGNSLDKTVNIVESYCQKYKYIQLLINQKQTAPYAMNMAIKKSRGEFIIRLDAHSEIPQNYFSELIKWSKKLNADNIGAICITNVKNQTSKSLSIIKVLTNKFGVGNSYFRIGIDKFREVDTVPFGCFRRDVFKKIGLYDTRLTRNQDIELNKRLKRNKGKIILLPHLFSIYFARETFQGIVENSFQTGLYNVLTVYFTKKISSLSLRHFIPLIFLLSLIVPLVVMIWEPIFGIISIIILMIYLSTLLTISIKLNDETTSFKYIVFAFIVLHLSYGFGSLLGLFNINAIFKKLIHE
jgi:glycosyltransferase involved in cell wall biosynthesis